jgi:hypothetical protein
VSTNGYSAFCPYVIIFSALQWSLHYTAWVVKLETIFFFFFFFFFFVFCCSHHLD